MRVFASCVAVLLCAGCGQSAGADAAPRAAPTVPSSSSSTVPSSDVDVTAVARARTELPAGYEVAPVSGPVAPIDLWGFGPDSSVDPQECGGLANPGAENGVAGWSASGPGGIVYAVAARAVVGRGPAVGEACAQWTVSGGHTEGVVSYLPAPSIADASAVGLATDLTTRVEGGTETHTHAETFTAYLDDHVAYVVVVTDPGSSGPPLAPGFASELLVETVSAIRG